VSELLEQFKKKKLITQVQVDSLNAIIIGIVNS